MTNAIYTDPDRRHDFILLFDVTDGNPNGDPDAGNLPRIDPQSLQGLITDGCLKRKIRNAISVMADGQPGCELYFQTQDAAYEKRILNLQHQRAYEAEGLGSGEKKKDKDAPAKTLADNTSKARKWMCQNFYDIRAFGAVMTTGVNCGQVRGPVQLTFSRSVDPVVPLDLSITRMAITRPEDLDAVVVEETAGRKGEQKGKVTEMARKAILLYGLYRGQGFFTPQFATQTRVTPEDLRLFWDAFVGMWDYDRSAARGL